MAHHNREESPLSVMTAILEKPQGYGRIIRDENNNFTIHASLLDDKIYDYECRVVDQNNEPFIYKGSLSTKCSDIILNNYQNKTYLQFI